MELTKKWLIFEVIRVLVVDHDSTSLKIVSKMLSLCGYEVISAKCAIDALRIVKEKESEIHLILTEVHLPDMGTYELLEKIMEQTYKLPIVIMSSNDNEIVKLGCLFKGAMLYLVKPLTMQSIRNLWQFSFIKGKERSVSISTPTRAREESINGNEPNMNKENHLIRIEKKKCQRIKRKEQEQGRKEVEKDGCFEYSTFQKRPKLVWTQQLHERFLQAIEVLGVDKAHPKEILQYMNIPGVRKENISSHLQKFRLSLKQEQDDAIEKKISQSSNLKEKQIPPSTNYSINSNVIGSCDLVSSDQSLTNCNMNNSCSMNSSKKLPLEEDQQELQNWFECEELREEITKLPSHVEEQHCMFEVGEGEFDGVFDVLKDFTMRKIIYDDLLI